MSIDLNFKASDDLFNYINNSNNEDNFNKITKIIENKVKLRMDKKVLTDIIQKYRNFDNDLSWISNEYKLLIIEKITEDLITEKIIMFYDNKT